MSHRKATVSPQKATRVSFLVGVLLSLTLSSLPGLIASAAGAIPGDFNADGSVSGADYVIWANNFGGSDAALAEGSHNSDGTVTGADYVIWANNFGATGPVKTYTHLPSLDPEWNNTESFDALEPGNFDAYWTDQLAALPAPDGAWSGGNIDLGGGKFGAGVINWNGATPAARKPCLIMLPSAGAPPSTGCCPGNSSFIIASAMGIGNAYRGGGDTITTALSEKTLASAGNIFIPAGDITASTHDRLTFEFGLDPDVWVDLAAYDATGISLTDVVNALNFAAQAAWGEGFAFAAAEYDPVFNGYRLRVTAATPGAGNEMTIGEMYSVNISTDDFSIDNGNDDGEFTEAILAIQQMIRNIQASGKCNGNFFVIGKSQGGGLALITAGLCPQIKDLFASVPAMTGFTGSGGTTGAWPNYPSTTEAGYLDAVNHAKRVQCKATFSISYNDAVTWGRGQVTAARNTQAHTTVNHGWDGHDDPNWWSLGTTWLSTLDQTVTNQPPSVQAGADQTLYAPTYSAMLDATVQDDGLPDPPAQVTVAWSEVSGPGGVTFTNSAAADTTATFTALGTYVLRLTASDSVLSAWDELTVTIHPEGYNEAPAVDVGPDRTVYLPEDSVALDATVQDDGRPLDPGQLALLWTQQSGPGGVVFADDSAADTTATFPAEGVYVLRLTADDGETASYDELTVTVSDAPFAAEGVLAPAGFGTAAGSEWCAATAAFDAQPTWDAMAGEPVGDDPSPYSGTDTDFPGRAWYIDFGPGYADCRITAIWTRYKPWSGGSYAGYGPLWWDDDNDVVNDDGVAETQLNFAAGQGVLNSAGQVWWQDVDVRSAPVAPPRRYLVISIGDNPSMRSNEFALIGYTVTAPMTVSQAVAPQLREAAPPHDSKAQRRADRRETLRARRDAAMERAAARRAAKTE